MACTLPIDPAFLPIMLQQKLGPQDHIQNIIGHCVNSTSTFSMMLRGSDRPQAEEKGFTVCVIHVDIRERVCSML